MRTTVATAAGAGMALLLSITAGGCASTVKVYAGPELPQSRVSTLMPDKASGSHLSEINIRRINGKQVDDLINPQYQVLPGQHTVNVEMRKEGPSRSVYATSRAINNVSFTALPGHNYRIVGDIQDGIGMVWVEDAASGDRVSE